MSILKTSRMDLSERLAMHLKLEVALQAEGYDGEPGVLQKVGKRFIRVSGRYFVPEAQQEIVLLGVSHRAAGSRVKVHTTYAGAFEARLIRTGTDFIELMVSRKDEEEDLCILIPFGKIVGIEPL
ncbi:hypothetical protein LJK88_45000 [Paenibacillus sp. P26]|nr:hypothetical protein LJK88_45000 [Paenibacillus sp. P26]UUZ92184.1 hypothetical protein LJK87_43345 [Paenibacillus sp. P25]